MEYQILNQIQYTEDITSGRLFKLEELHVLCFQHQSNLAQDDHSIVLMDNISYKSCCFIWRWTHSFTVKIFPSLPKAADGEIVH